MTRIIISLIFVGTLLGLAMAGTDVLNPQTSAAQAEKMQAETEHQRKMNRLEEQIKAAQTQAEIERLQHEREMEQYRFEAEAIQAQAEIERLQHERELEQARFEAELQREREQNAHDWWVTQWWYSLARTIILTLFSLVAFAVTIMIAMKAYFAFKNYQQQHQEKERAYWQRQREAARQLERMNRLQRRRAQKPAPVTPKQSYHGNDDELPLAM